MADIGANVAAVRGEIAAACARSGREAGAVRLIAVTKSVGPETLAALVAAGVMDAGENRVEHLAAMRAAAPPSLDFHYIGRVQSRQLGDVVGACVALHSLCDLGHLPRLERLCAERGARIEAFIQVNTSGEAAKAGLAPHELDAFLGAARAIAGVTVVGLMTMAPELAHGHADPAAVRACFRELARLARERGLPRLSMGMSQDFAIAVEEGATDVRVGTRLFA